jgi:cobalt-zinc-cadmium efflux system protein
MGSHHHHEHTHHYHTNGDHHHHNTGNIGVAFWLNFIFCLIEFAGGFFTNSVAISSNALHDLGDAFSLGLAWYFEKISHRKRDKMFSYGYKRFSLLGALINSLILLVGSVFIIRETVPRIFHPETTNTQGIIVFALMGIFINTIAVLRLQKGSSLNERVISLHFIEDVLGWVAVLLSAVVMLFTDMPLLDPLLSLGITLYILYNVFKNLKHTLTILLQAVPMDIHEEELKKELLTIPNILNVHDVHIWTLDGEYNIVSIHLVLKNHSSLEEAEIVKSKAREILHHLNVHHITIETESQQQTCDLLHC